MFIQDLYSWNFCVTSFIPGAPAMSVSTPVIWHDGNMQISRGDLLFPHTFLWDEVLDVHGWGIYSSSFVVFSQHLKELEFLLEGAAKSQELWTTIPLRHSGGHLRRTLQHLWDIQTFKCKQKVHQVVRKKYWDDLRPMILRIRGFKKFQLDLEISLILSSSLCYMNVYRKTFGLQSWTNHCPRWWTNTHFKFLWC